MAVQAPARPLRAVFATLCGVLLVSTLLLGGASDASAAPGGRATSPARARAERSLVRAERLLVGSPQAHAGSTGAEHAASPHRDATLALRDLGQYRDDLSAADQRRAARLLERPTTTSAIGTNDVVVHFTPGQVAPDYPQRVLDTATTVRNTYIAAGYRVPKTDGALGGDARFDIYLTDLRTSGAYGYCTSDQPRSKGRAADRWAYCVLDNSYERFPGTATPTQLLQVTLAHEYFHAVQYSYDSYEDGWFLEGTAAWIEDYMFDDVNDNMQYAPFSPLAGPRSSLDEFDQGGYRQYGTWLWFRWLTERYPESQGGLPVIVRQMWEAADSTGSGKDLYSVQAINKALKAHGTTLTKAFALFADANRRPASFYSEAVANGYPTAPLAGKAKLSRRSSTTKVVRLDHLSSATTRFVPKRLASRKYHLKLRFDLADKRTGSAAVVSTYLSDGEVRTKLVRLDRRGNSALRVPFSTRTVSGVEVTLVNASQRFTQCYRYAVKFSCYGKPVDQNVTERVRATVVR